MKLAKFGFFADKFENNILYNLIEAGTAGTKIALGGVCGCTRGPINVRATKAVTYGFDVTLG